MDLGRRQQGQYVNLRVETTDSSGDPAQPDAAPVATITDAGSNVVATIKIPMSRVENVFSLPLFLGASYLLGTYIVEYSWSVGGVIRNSSDSFDVIHGGDIGGGVIAIYGYDRPEARYVVAQLSSGKLVQGRNPKF